MLLGSRPIKYTFLGHEKCHSHRKHSNWQTSKLAVISSTYVFHMSQFLHPGTGDTGNLLLANEASSKNSRVSSFNSGFAPASLWPCLSSLTALCFISSPAKWRGSGRWGPALQPSNVRIPTVTTNAKLKYSFWQLPGCKDVAWTLYYIWSQSGYIARKQLRVNYSFIAFIFSLFHQPSSLADINPNLVYKATPGLHCSGSPARQATRGLRIHLAPSGVCYSSKLPCR